ncbi:chitin synthase-domain-containing protein [Zychaea mexicana]|uniref:chitin synthase-domain-containing protein n=1 Tax=Zychaea mexicana TaxID=64656 RepID=UPI0022FE12AC|nr:chitin synthase-domain-containing protein [Zychaea mexicana]KAI9492396.1 chitin synthase-domain-containing protein [Zychaea mexicana]
MRTLTCRRIAWVLLSRICTIIFPDFVLKYIVGLHTAAARQAWREKITTCFLFIALVGFFLFWIEYVSTLFCDSEDVVPQGDVFKNESKYIALNGQAAEWSKYQDSSRIAKEVVPYNGLDVSPMFPTFLMLDRKGLDTYRNPTLRRCIAGGDTDRSAQADKWLTYKLANDSGYRYDGNELKCPYPNDTTVSGAPCYSWPFNALPLKGDIVYQMDDISNFTTLSSPDTLGKAYVVLNGKVLDVTSYLETATDIVEVSSGVYSRAFALDRMFLPLDVTMLLFISLGEDISEYFTNNVTNPNLYERCLDELFFKGIIEEAEPSGCKNVNPALWATMGVGLLYFLLKMHLAHLCRLQIMQRFLFSSTPELSSAMRSTWPHTILMVPCYAEPSTTIKQTIESLARTHYEDSRKLLMFVCDGLTNSKQDSKETYACVLELLGYSGTDDPASQPYISLGQNRKRINYAKVYSGYYETGRNRVPYLVVVKLGAAREAPLAQCAPGNRGKRDSMVLVLGFLERCMNLASNRMTPLEYELFNQCYSVLGINPRNFKYMLVTDADTQVQGDVVQKMVSRLEKDRKMLAISGHVRPANPEQNITTMLQIFPLYQTFYSGLAYEAFLGTVISINGGFVMYKLWTENVPDEPKSSKASRWQHLKRISSTSTSQQTIRSHSKWPKVSDEIDPAHDDSDTRSMTTGEESRLSLAPNAGIRPCCIHPTVLRGFAAPQPDTLHMQNVLLLGEEQYLSTVLLRSHPQHRLGFEPEAVGYVTLPTNIFALQALQSRNLRSTFHNQIEMHRIAWDVGIGCWIISFTKLLDMIFSVPIIIYLYSVYIRFFMSRHLAYAIIALSFTCLITLHIIYFIVRRQFKYVLWFVIYGLFSVPLFAVWFPLVAVWCSDYARRWYDVWPTSNGCRGRLHGVVDHERDEPSDDDYSEQKQLSDEELVPRMRLNEFEVFEAEKAYQRAMQEAVALDSNFTGFTGFVSGRASIHSTDSWHSNSLLDPNISTPPIAQLRNNGHHSVRVGKSTTSGFKPVASVVDMYGTVRNVDGLRRQRDPFEDPSPTASVRSGSFADPFASALDNPFDDGYAVNKQGGQGGSVTYNSDEMHRTRRQQHIGKHKPSHSQSSYFTYSSYNTNDEYPPYYPAATTMDGGGFVSNVSSSAPTRSRSYSAESAIPADRRSINSTVSNTLSLASSNLSLDPEASLEHSRYPSYPATGSMSASAVVDEDNSGEEGRRSAFHSKVGLKIPGHVGGLRGVGYGNTGAAGAAPNPSNLPNRVRSTRRRRVPAELSLHHRDTSDTSYRPTEMSTLPRTAAAGISDTGSSSNNSSGNGGGGDIRGVIEQEVRTYLGSADLDSTTRAQVKQHLCSVFGDRIERDEPLQEFINKSIEDITLQLLTRPSAPN